MNSSCMLIIERSLLYGDWLLIGELDNQRLLNIFTVREDLKTPVNVTSTIHQYVFSVRIAPKSVRTRSVDRDF